MLKYTVSTLSEDFNPEPVSFTATRFNHRTPAGAQPRLRQATSKAEVAHRSEATWGCPRRPNIVTMAIGDNFDQQSTSRIDHHAPHRAPSRRTLLPFFITL